MELKGNSFFVNFLHVLDIKWEMFVYPFPSLFLLFLEACALHTYIECVRRV